MAQDKDRDALLHTHLCYAMIFKLYQALIVRLGNELAPSSSGLGYLVLIQKIAGSNPAGVTMTLFNFLQR